jgi:hypothetical protein
MMADVLRCLASLLFMSLVTLADGDRAHAQTIGSDRRQGSPALLEALRNAELRGALANEAKARPSSPEFPNIATTFPLPSCLFPGGLCGAITRDGSAAVAPRYDWVDKFYEGRALVRSNGLYGYIDTAGKVIAEPQYETAGTYSGGLAEVSVDGKSGLIDLEGHMVLEPRFARAHPYTADVFWVNDGRRRYQGRPGAAELVGREVVTVTDDIEADGKWGLIARSGEWVRRPDFAGIGTFDREDRSLVRVKAEAGWGVIKPDGSWLIEPQFESLGHLYNGLAPAYIGGKSGFIDRTGKFVIPAKFDRAGYFESDGLSLASVEKKWGLIDRSGAWVIEPQYDVISRPRGKTIFWVRIGEKFGAIDRSGKLIVEPRFSQTAGLCDDGWAIGFDNGKQRAVPSAGMQLVMPNGELFGSNCKDAFQLEVNGKFGLVDRTLNPLTEVRFDRIDGFWNGAAIAKIDGKLGYLNPDGSWLIEPQFDDAGNFVGDYAIAGLGGRYGCIRRNSAWAIEPQFEDKGFNCEVMLRKAKSDQLDPRGTLTIDPRIRKVGFLTDGFYTVKVDGKFGVVNDGWNWLIEPRWRSYGRFVDEGLRAAKFDDKWGFIDASGALIIEDNYDSFSFFSRGIAWVQSGSSWCAIDKHGQRVPSLPCQETTPNPQPGTVTFRTRG